MVNETRIYSALQNIPYTTLLGNYDTQTAANLLVLPPGKYEIKITGAMNPDATTGSRQIRLGSFLLLEWNNSADQPQVTLHDLCTHSSFLVLFVVLVDFTLPSCPLLILSSFSPHPALSLCPLVSPHPAISSCYLILLPRPLLISLFM